MSNQKVCEFEQTIVKSLKAGFISEESREHSKECADCRETVKIAGWLQMSAKTAQPKNLPTAGFLWWKSRIIEKRRAAENTAKPILIAQTVAVIVAFGTFIWMMSIPTIKFSSVGTTFSHVFALMEPVAVLLIAGLICFALVCSMLILTLRRFLLEK